MSFATENQKAIYLEKIQSIRKKVKELRALCSILIDPDTLTQPKDPSLIRQTGHLHKDISDQWKVIPIQHQLITGGRAITKPERLVLDSPDLETVLKCLYEYEHGSKQKKGKGRGANKKEKSIAVELVEEEEEEKEAAAAATLVQPSKPNKRRQLQLIAPSTREEFIPIPTPTPTPTPTQPQHHQNNTLQQKTYQSQQPLQQCPPPLQPQAQPQSQPQAQQILQIQPPSQEMMRWYDMARREQQEAEYWKSRHSLLVQGMSLLTVKSEDDL